MDTYGRLTCPLSSWTGRQTQRAAERQMVDGLDLLWFDVRCADLHLTLLADIHF